MEYRQATIQQLFTIAYHEPCSKTDKLLAMMELTRRKQSVPRNQNQAHIKRKRG